MFNVLSLEIVQLVLSFLPIGYRPLAKSVCKIWYDLITDLEPKNESLKYRYEEYDVVTDLIRNNDFNNIKMIFDSLSYKTRTIIPAYCAYYDNRDGILFCADHGYGWNNLATTFAVMNDNLDLIKWAKKNNFYITKKIINLAAFYGRLDILNWYNENYFLSNEDICGSALRGMIFTPENRTSPLDILKWLGDYGYLQRKLQIDRSMVHFMKDDSFTFNEEEYLKILEHIVNINLYIPAGSTTFNKLVQFGSIKLLEWLISIGFYFSLNAFYYAAKDNSIEKIEWLISHGLSVAHLCSEVARAGNLEILKWAIERGYGYTISTETLNYAFKSNNKELIEWLINEKKIKITSYTNVIAYRDLEILEWAKAENVHFNPNNLSEALSTGDLNIIKWVIENGCRTEEILLINALNTYMATINTEMLSKDMNDYLISLFDYLYTMKLITSTRYYLLETIASKNLLKFLKHVVSVFPCTEDTWCKITQSAITYNAIDVLKWILRNIKINIHCIYLLKPNINCINLLKPNKNHYFHIDNKLFGKKIIIDSYPSNLESVKIYREYLKTLREQ